MQRESLQVKTSNGYHCSFMLWAFQLLRSRFYVQHHYFNVSLHYHYHLIFPTLTSPKNTTVATVSIFPFNSVKGEASSQIRRFSHAQTYSGVFLFIASRLPQAGNTLWIFKTINTFLHCIDGEAAINFMWLSQGKSTLGKENTPSIYCDSHQFYH